MQKAKHMGSETKKAQERECEGRDSRGTVRVIHQEGIRVYTTGTGSIFSEQRQNSNTAKGIPFSDILRKLNQAVNIQALYGISYLKPTFLADPTIF